MPPPSLSHQVTFSFCPRPPDPNSKRIFLSPTACCLFYPFLNSTFLSAIVIFPFSFLTLSNSALQFLTISLLYFSLSFYESSSPTSVIIGFFALILTLFRYVPVLFNRFLVFNGFVELSIISSVTGGCRVQFLFFSFYFSHEWSAIFS